MPPKTVNNKKVKRGKAKRPRVRATAQTSGDAKVAGHFGMLVDPCAGDLRPSVYRGRAGYTARFSNWFTGSLTANGAALLAWNPGCGRVSYTTGANSTTAIVPAWGLSNNGMSAPLGFVAGSSRGMRCVAACITLSYIGTELNRGGTVGVAVGPADEVLGAASTNVGLKLNVCQTVARLPDDSFEIKFVPTPADEEYVDVNVGVPDFFGDKCALLCAIVAPSAGMEFRARLTAIYEYLPADSANMPLPSATAHNPVGGLERLISAAHKMGNFVTNLDRLATTVYGTAKQVVNTNAFRSAAALTTAMM